jgi:chromate transporter
MMSRASQIISWATTRKTVAGPERAPLLALFIGFLKVSFFSTGGGGGIVFARRLVVEQRRWMDDHDFAEILSLCQFMPGPSLVGVAVWVGSRLRGMTGAIASLTGFTVIPLTIGFLLGTWCLRNTHLAMLQGILGGVSAAAAGLVIGTGLRLLVPYRDHPMALSFAALAFGGLVFTKLPLLIIIIALAPLSVAIAAIFSARGQ